MSSNIIDFDKDEPHRVSEVICIGCVHRWLAVRPTSAILRQIICPGCGEPETTIETGQPLELQGEVNDLSEWKTITIGKGGIITKME